MKKVKSIQQISFMEHIEGIYCDKCGDKIESNRYNQYNPSWFKADFTRGHEDGGCTELHTMDLCENCSRKLLDKLKELGYNITMKRIDW